MTTVPETGFSFLSVSSRLQRSAYSQKQSALKNKRKRVFVFIWVIRVDILNIQVNCFWFCLKPPRPFSQHLCVPSEYFCVVFCNGPFLWAISAVICSYLAPGRPGSSWHWCPLSGRGTHWPVLLIHYGNNLEEPRKVTFLCFGPTTNQNNLFEWGYGEVPQFGEGLIVKLVMILAAEVLKF